MTTPLEYQFQEDFETPTFGVRDASTERRPDGISLDYLTAWSTGPAQVGDTVSEGPEGRLWRARIVTQGTILLCRSTAGRDAWLDLEEFAAVEYPASFPVEELTLAFTAGGDWILVAQRPTGGIGVPELWLASSNPFL